jgi:uncharacterized membrane protein (DUF373 family)
MAGTQQIRPPQFAANSVEQLWRPEVGCTTQPKKPFGQPDDGLNSRGRHHCVTEPLLSNWRCHPDRGCDRLARIKGYFMPDFGISKPDWKKLLTYEFFERAASRVVMLFIAIIIVYTLILMALTLFDQLKFNPTYIDTEALREVFGSILSILILIEFNHSIALAITKRSGVLQARPIVLITILVIARKVILLDFSTASFEQLIGIGALAIAFGLLFWLISARAGALESRPQE